MTEIAGMTEHTVRAFSVELEELSGELSSMGGKVEDMLSDAISAAVSADPRLAEDVVLRDPEIDAYQIDIERRILRLLALRQPLARDLRHTVAALKIAGDLERIGDLSKNIAKRALAMENVDAARLKGVSRMGRLVAAQLKRVLDAYSAADTDSAAQVWFRDEEVDEHYNSLFRELLTYMMEDHRTIGGCTHLLFIAKNLERIGDHCTNIAEVIHFLVTGEAMTSERPKVDDLERS